MSMDFNFLSPVANIVLAHNELLPKQALGKTIKIHSEKSGLPDISNAKIAIVGIDEMRNAIAKQKQHIKISNIRTELYKLFVGNWDCTIVDLGNIIRGETVEDTYYAVKTLTSELIKNKTIPVFIGGSQDLTYAAYRSYDHLNQMVNIVSVDAKFDFGASDELISSQSYMSKIINKKK